MQQDAKIQYNKNKLVTKLAGYVITNCGYRGSHELRLPWESRIVVTVVLLPVACV
jgi:hypothetical protein